MFHSYHVPPNFEQEWRTIGEAMERYFAHKGIKQPQATVYAKVEKLEHSFLDTMIRVAALFVVACAMLCTLCYFMELDRKQALGSNQEKPKMELKSDFFAQPAFAFDNQNKQTQLSGSSLHPHYQPGFGLPRRFGSND
ncbi:MAG: hypothetical protein KIT34_13585 [Cyanobacteria bacterium TGS_CYA1]|nr:hypothetical protein [Cyanobacteria bacterium TGS_CYA1]